MGRLAPVLVATLFTAIGSSAFAQSSAGPEPAHFRFGGSLGIDLWPELGDVQSILGDDFEEAGLAVELNLHGGGWIVGPARIFAGIDLGVISNESDVEGIAEGEDLQASFLYLTPSIKAVFGRPDRLNWTLDAGVGYYDVSIDEWEDDCFWDCDVYEYYDDSAIGGYVGVGLEVPFGGAETRLRFTGGVRVHFVDFDEVTDPILSGSVDGPIYVLAVGVGFYR